MRSASGCLQKFTPSGLREVVNEAVRPGDGVECALHVMRIRFGDTLGSDSENCIERVTMLTAQFAPGYLDDSMRLDDVNTLEICIR